MKDKKMFPRNLLSCIDYPTLSFTSIKFQKFLLPPKAALSKILLPTLRTNPFLKVPDLFCRLHLPTLLYRPEAWNKQYVHSTYPHLEKHADKFATELLGFLSKVGSSQDLESKVAQDFHETGRGKPRRKPCRQGGANYVSNLLLFVTASFECRHMCSLKHVYMRTFDHTFCIAHHK